MRAAWTFIQHRVSHLVRQVLVDWDNMLGVFTEVNKTFIPHISRLLLVFNVTLFVNNDSNLLSSLCELLSVYFKIVNMFIEGGEML